VREAEEQTRRQPVGCGIVVGPRHRFPFATARTSGVTAVQRARWGIIRSAFPHTRGTCFKADFCHQTVIVAQRTFGLQVRLRPYVLSGSRSYLPFVLFCHLWVLFLDGHSSHYTADLLEYCEANNIRVLGYPPHCTHALQGLDVLIGGSQNKFICARDSPAKIFCIGKRLYYMHKYLFRP
jgi:hypothetical protein